MLRYIYEQMLEAQISKSRMPECVAIVLNSGDLDYLGLKKVRSVVEWGKSLGIGCIALYMAEETEVTYLRILSELSDVAAEVSVHTKEGIVATGDIGGIKLVISLGYGGKQEVAEAIKKLMKDVELGKILPENINEKDIEANLRFHKKPDLVIRAGGKQLSDFMIWQAVYSELYFTEVNWNSLRKIDFLRAIRAFQQRERRFGK